MEHTKSIRIFQANLVSSLEYYKDSMPSLVMTIFIPMGFLVFFSLIHYAGAMKPAVTVGTTSSASKILEQHNSVLNLEGVITVPIVGSGRYAVSSNEARLALDVDENNRLRVYAKSQDQAFVELMTKYLRQELNADVTSYRVDSESSDFFFLPGALMMSLMNLALFTFGAKLLQDRSSGVLRIYRLLPASIFIWVSSELLSKIILAFIQASLFILAGNVILDMGLTLSEVLIATAVAVLTFLSLLSLGFALGACLNGYTNGYNVFVTFNLMMIFFGDIIFFSSSLEFLRPFSFLLPTTHCVDLLRQTLLGMEPNFPVYVGVSYLTVFTCAMLTIGLQRFKFTADP